MRFRTARSNCSLGVGRRVRVLSYGSVTALSRRYFDEIQIGEEYESPGRTVPEADIVIFAGLSGDYNVLHTDAEFMQQSIYGARIDRYLGPRGDLARAHARARRGRRLGPRSPAARVHDWARLAGAEAPAGRARVHGHRLAGAALRPRRRHDHDPGADRDEATDARRRRRHRGARSHRPARRGGAARPLHLPRREAHKGDQSMTFDPRHKSRTILDGPDRAAARAFFRAIGFTDDDLKRPLIGVAHCWIEITPCNWNHRKLAEKVKEGVRAAGGTPIEFNSITVTDGIAMGTEGMKASLISRETVADSVELVVRGHLMDAFVGISGCDKTIPAMVMAMARLDLPSVMLYGGSILYGEYKGRRLTIQDVFEAVGAFNAGKIDAQELGAIESRACPGGGACGGQFTANTMATAFEMLGVSAMGFNDVPAMDPRKEEIAFETGKLVMDLLKKGVRPRQLITKRALQNAIAGVMATGGSTNAVLHLLAVAKEAGVKLTIDEFDPVSRRTPLLAELKPWGSYTAPEMYEAGGMAVVAQRLPGA